MQKSQDKKYMKIGIISMYPQKGQKHPKSGGVSSYTKNLISEINTNIKENDEIIIFSEKISNISTKYIEGNVIVHRCWNSDLRYVFQIIRELKKYEFDLVHIQFEYFLYGNILSTLLFPILLSYLRILHIPVIITIHQVIPLSKLDNKFRRDNSTRGLLEIQKIGLLIITKIMVRLSHKVIVHEEYFRCILYKEYNCCPMKIIVIPHGIEEKKDIKDMEKAKEILKLSDKRIILYFGYISRYKGLEYLIDAFKLLPSNFVLIIAGGKHPRLTGDDKYEEYIMNLKNRANNISQNIIFTGFVNEDRIPLYFSAADCVIFPYTSQVSSSGPLALAAAYEKPFLVSDEFKYITLSDIIFSNEAGNIAKKIKDFFEDENLKKCAVNYSKKLKSERNWKEVAVMTLNTYCKVDIYNSKR